MATKNILVSKNYDIVDHTKWHNNRTTEPMLVESYNQMHQLMVESAQQYVTNLDDIVVHTGAADNIREVFRIHFGEIYRLWQTGANILYVDLDVLFVKPYDIFEQFDFFAMFNYTTPRKVNDQHYGIRLAHYFNCGIRYYPATMSENCWNTGLAMLENWNPNLWDAEQVIYNQMMWSQGVTLDQVLKPEMAYQYIHDKEPCATSFNQISVDQARAIHFHGSRGVMAKVKKMKEYRDATTEVQ